METAVNRNVFLENLYTLISRKREDNCFYFSQEKYSKIISEVISAKAKCVTPLDYRRLKRFDVLKIKDEERLIVPLKPGETNLQYYVTNEELFTILHDAHIKTGHGGRTRMLKELQVRYKNITYEVVMLYLSLCKQCQAKHSASKKGVIVMPAISSELDSRCQVDLIEMQSDGEYNFIMVYQDDTTKFLLLKALKTKTAKEVAQNVLSIFLTFGAPAILQSGDGRDFSKEIITQICSLWKEVRIVSGKPCQTLTETESVKNMITVWMNDNNTNKWSDGLPFVQFAKNTAHREEIRQSPHEAVFGSKPKTGITSPFFRNIETEEQLEEIANSFEIEEKNLSGSYTENYIQEENNEEDVESSQQVETEETELISAKRAAPEENQPQATKIFRK